MKLIRLLAILFLLTSKSYSQDFITPSLKNSFALNHHTNRDVDYFSMVDHNENIISIATTERDSTFTDILTTKLDVDLKELWQKRFSLETSLSYDIPLNSIIDDNNNIYIVGRSATDQSSQNGLLFVVKYDTNGKELWFLNLDDYNDSLSDDYLYQNSFIDDNGFLHIVHAKSNQTYTAAKFYFYTINKSGVITETFSREDLVNDFDSEFTELSYEFFYKNNEYYLLYRRYDYSSGYDHFIKKINNNSLENYPLNALIDANDTSFFSQGKFEVDSNSNIYLGYQSSNSDVFKLLKIDSTGDLIYNIVSPASYDKDILALYLNKNSNLSILSNSKITASSEEKTLNLLVYDDYGNIMNDINTTSTFVNGLKAYPEDQSILVFSNGNFKLFDNTSLNLISEFSGAYNNFNDFNKINHSSLVFSRTTFQQMYTGSDFATQQDLEIKKIDNSQVLNTYNFSGVGTSKAYNQIILLDHNNNTLIIAQEKLGPDNLSIGGSRAPINRSLYKYDTNLNLLWHTDFSNSIVETNTDSDKNYILDANNNIYLNTEYSNNQTKYYELIKISENGTIVFQVPSYRSIHLYFDQNNNLNMVSPPGMDDDDTIIYTINPNDGTLLSSKVFEGLAFMESFLSRSGNSYIYMYTGDNSYGDTSPKLKIYKNLNLEFETNLAMTGTYESIDYYAVNNNGDFNFSSSWAQINLKLHSITLQNEYKFINLSEKISRLITTSNDNIFTLNESGYIKIYSNNLNLLASSTKTYYDIPYLLEVGNYIFLNTYWDNIVKVFDYNAVEINEFKLPSFLSFEYATTDSNNDLILTGKNGNQIYTYQEYSWARGFVHKYDFSNFNLSTLIKYEIDAHQLAVFPNPTNPTSSIIKIDNLNHSILNVKFYNLNGTFLFNTKESTIDISNLPPSIYLLKIYLADGTTVNKKIVKK